MLSMPQSYQFIDGVNNLWMTFSFSSEFTLRMPLNTFLNNNENVYMRVWSNLKCSLWRTKQRQTLLPGNVQTPSLKSIVKIYQVMGTGLNCDVDCLKIWFNIFSKYFIQQVIDLLLIIYHLLAYMPMRKRLMWKALQTLEWEGESENSQ